MATAEREEVPLRKLARFIEKQDVHPADRRLVLPRFGKLTLMVRELLTREDFFRQSGVIVVVDDASGRTAHPTNCPSLDLAHFVEKVIRNQRKNGQYYWAASFGEASQDLVAQPCHCA